MTRKRRRSAVTTPAGPGADGHLYGVTSLVIEAGTSRTPARAKPCGDCPWRMDSPVGAFPAEAFRISARTCHDTAISTFSCHDSGIAKPAICAGFLLANAEHNIGVRLGQMSSRLGLEKVGNPDDVPLYASYRDMAIANGVDPADPAIAPCRGNDEDGFTVAARIRAASARGPFGIEAVLRDGESDDQ